MAETQTQTENDLVEKTILESAMNALQQFRISYEEITDEQLREKLLYLFDVRITSAIYYFDNFVTMFRTAGNSF